MFKRILTGLVAIPIVIAIIHTGGYIFTSAVFALANIGIYELYMMAKRKECEILFPTTAMVIAMMILSAMLEPPVMMPILTCGIIVTLLHGMFKHSSDSKWIGSATISLTGLCYVGLLFAHFVLLRNISLGREFDLGICGLNFEVGEALIWIIVLGTWASDTFAYFAGRAFGKHKLWPAVSPKKTIEGAVAGAIGCVAVIFWLMNALEGTGIPTENLFECSLVTGLLIAIFAPLGDLVESIMKRSFDIKDSGNIFPGHGGVLDRCDSLLFAIPIGYYVIMYYFAN